MVLPLDVSLILVLVPALVPITALALGCCRCPTLTTALALVVASTKSHWFGPVLTIVIVINGFLILLLLLLLFVGVSWFVCGSWV